MFIVMSRAVAAGTPVRSDAAGGVAGRGGCSSPSTYM